MQTLTIPVPSRPYPVYVGQDLLSKTSLWQKHLPEAEVFLVSNDIVAPLYLDQVRSALGDTKCKSLVLPDGEDQKNHQNWQRIHEFLAHHHAGRDACLVALGGGVIGDLVGFAAATWMRGIRFVQVPTTLLAQVDASVGGKTAINIPEGKNLVGAFHQPSAVLADTGTLETLPDREYRAGLAEVVKYGAIRDPKLLAFLEKHTRDLLSREPACVDEIVSRSVTHKAQIVAEDEREQGVRAILNFGHSFGHALETHTGYQEYLHGEAVAIGMLMAARLSELRGLEKGQFADRLGQLLQALGLPVNIPAGMSSRELLAHMKYDKKNLSGKRRLILLSGPGKAIIDARSTDEDILRAIGSCHAGHD